MSGYLTYPQTLKSMAEGIERPDGQGNLRVELLTGSVKGKARQVLLDDVKAGKVPTAVRASRPLLSLFLPFRSRFLSCSKLHTKDSCTRMRMRMRVRDNLDASGANGTVRY